MKLALLQIELAESDLPFKVDLIDWRTISDEFRQIIKKKYTIL
jgi:hypothetical protein